MHASLPIFRVDYIKRARLKVEEGVRLAFGSRRRVEEYHAILEAEEEAHLVEEARLKAEEEEQDRIRADDEAQLSKQARQKAEEHKCARMKVEYGVYLALEAI